MAAQTDLPPMPRRSAATLAAQVPLPPSPPPSVVGADERTFGTQTVEPVIEIAPPMRRAERASATQTGAPAERTFGTQTVEPVIEIAPPTRRGNYRAGFYNILPNIVPPAALAAQVRNMGITEGYRQGRQRGEAIGAVQGAAEAIAGLTFEQRTAARGVETFTVPELQARFAEGQIMRVPAGRPRVEAVQAVAEEAAPK